MRGLRLCSNAQGWPPWCLASSLVLLLLCVRVGTASLLVQADDSPFVPTISTQEKCPKLRIALVNGVSFHFEILAGMLHVLRPWQKNIDVYMSPWIRSENYDGAWDLVRWSKASFKSINSSFKNLGFTYDLVVLISPDYELQQNKQLLDVMQPRLTVAIVHNADFANMTDLINMVPNMQLLTLSPHVATTLADVTSRPTDWILPVYPVRPEPDCTSKGGNLMGMCLRGFAMQGKFSNLRRNYTSVWNQMSNKLDVLNDPQMGKVFHMHVLGKGPDRLNIPMELQPHISVHRRLAFGAFYTVIFHSLALVPSLANPKYFSHKFSSTCITSLSTGTPLIASEQLLRSYNFLERGATFVQGQEEEEIDVMLRIAMMTPDEILQVRSRLKELRTKLNQRSFKLMESYLANLCS